MRLITIFKWLIISSALVYIVWQSAAYLCQSELEEIGLISRFVRRILAFFYSTFEPTPTACVLQEALDFPVMLLFRMLFAYSCTLVATLTLVFIDGDGFRRLLQTFQLSSLTNSTTIFIFSISRSMLLISIYKWLIISSALVYIVWQSAAYQCQSELEEISFISRFISRILTLFDSSFEPTPTVCVLQEALDFPVMLLFRMLFAYSCTLVATLAVVFIEGVIARVSHECRCLP